MGGVAKGLLKAPGSKQTLLERLLGELRLGLPDAPVVLVGDAAAYAFSELPVVSDAPASVGPIGGLGGLLLHAHEHGAAHALALACDLPRIQAPLLARLGTETPKAAALFTLQDGIRNPLVARYHVPRALPAVEQVVSAGKRSLQAVLDALGADVEQLSLTPEEARTLDDWDTPEDVVP